MWRKDYQEAKKDNIKQLLLRKPYIEIYLPIVYSFLNKTKQLQFCRSQWETLNLANSPANASSWKLLHVT